MATQYYKITKTGESYALDKATGKASKVSSIPTGGATITWGGSNLPSALQNIQTTTPTPTKQPASTYTPPTTVIPKKKVQPIPTFLIDQLRTNIQSGMFTPEQALNAMKGMVTSGGYKAPTGGSERALFSGLTGIKQKDGSIGSFAPYTSGIPQIITTARPTQITQVTADGVQRQSGVLTPSQQTEYFSTQGQSANPLSPTDWLKSKTNINKDAISTLPSVVDEPKPSDGTSPDLSGVDTTEDVDIGNETFNTSLQNQVNNLKAQIEDENTKRQAEDQTLIDRYTKEIDELNQLQADNLSDKGSAILETKQRALDALEEGSVIFRKAQQEKIELGNQLQNLLEQGQALIKQQQGVTGLSSIRTPRINKTISDVNAQAGIIQAAINAKQGDMNSAFGILEATATAVSLYGQNELNYFEGIDNFYKNQKGDAFTKLSLDKEQKEYLDFKINTLKDELAVVENNKETLQELFTDPDMATLFAKAGISMNTPQSEWGSKIAKYENTQEIADFKNDKLAEGYVYKPAGNGNTTFSVGGKNLSFNAPPEKVPGGDTPDDEITLPNTATTKLLGAGFTKDEISQIEESVNTYAIKATLFAIDDENQRRIVAEVYGAEDILDQVEEELSPEEEKIPWWTTWFGIGK